MPSKLQKFLFAMTRDSRSMQGLTGVAAHAAAYENADDVGCALENHSRKLLPSIVGVPTKVDFNGNEMLFDEKSISKSL